jgi:hypothetical protein
MSRKTKGFPARKTVAIVGDGHTERIYFSDLKETDRPANLSIFPDYPRKMGSFIGVLERAIELSNDYEMVFALVDMDKIIKEKQYDKYQKLKEQAQKNGAIVLENNPCIEIWFLLHFITTGKLFNNCNEVSNQLNKRDRIKSYDKSEKFLVQARLYKTLKHLIKNTTMPNAKLLEKDRTGKDELYPRAEIFRFFEWYFEQLPK